MTYSVKDIQDRFGVGEQTVLGWIRTGELKAINVSRRAGAKKPRWRITDAALAAFEALRTANPPPSKSLRRKRPADVIEFYK
jgi:transposase